MSRMNHLRAWRLWMPALLTLVILLAGCAGAPAPTVKLPTTIPAATFPMTVTDSLKRQVTLSVQPMRLVSLAPSVTEILFAVGAGEAVVGVTSYCNYPPEALTKPQIGGFSANTISVEKIVALKPDLVLASDAFQQPVIDALVALNVPVASVTATTINGVYDNITFVGRVTGHANQTAQLVARMQARIQAVQDKVGKLAKEKRVSVFWETWDEPLMTAGPTSFTGQLVEAAGGSNIFADLKEEWPTVSSEEIIKRNPAVILSPNMMTGQVTIEKVSQRPGWATVDAVRNQRIYLIDGDISSRSGPRVADGVELIAKALYPDLFK
jgi:iron complex transport system substrate-binding protein